MNPGSRNPAEGGNYCGGARRKLVPPSGPRKGLRTHDRERAAPSGTRHGLIRRSGAQTIGWYRVEIESVHDRQRHYVDVEGFDEFEATREALDQNKHASSAKIVRRYYDGEKLLGNW